MTDPLPSLYTISFLVTLSSRSQLRRLRASAPHLPCSFASSSSEPGLMTNPGIVANSGPLPAIKGGTVNVYVSREVEVVVCNGNPT